MSSFVFQEGKNHWEYDRSTQKAVRNIWNLMELLLPRLSIWPKDGGANTSVAIVVLLVNDHQTVETVDYWCIYVILYNMP